MAEIDIDKVRSVIEAALDGRPEGFADRPEMTEEETQVVDNCLTHAHTATTNRTFPRK